jgi:hypothetical protein
VPSETLGIGFGCHWKLVASVKVFQCLGDRSEGGG